MNYINVNLIGIAETLVSMEPVKKKLRRWILGEKNLPPLSITEQQIPPMVNRTFTATQIKDLCTCFRKIDDQVHFGFGFKFMSRIFKAMGIQMSEKEREAFLHKTGYVRKLNQDSTAMTLAVFLEELAMRTVGMSDSQRADFVLLFIQLANNLLPKVDSPATRMGTKVFPS